MKNVVIISTLEGIAAMIDTLVTQQRLQPESFSALYIDLEGVDLCRSGSVSLLTLLYQSSAAKAAYIIDVHVLGAQAFTTPGSENKTLKDILEEPAVRKIFFDDRNDSDALFAHFGVALQGVEDVQLMESAARKTRDSRTFLTSLTKCVENNAAKSLIDTTRLAHWKQAKLDGERLYKSEYGGSYAVFNKRPLPETVISYCVADVQFLPDLRESLMEGLPQSSQLRDLIRTETAERVAASQRPDYEPHGSNRARAPWSAEQHAILDQGHGATRLLYEDDDLYNEEDEAMYQQLDDIYIGEGDDDFYGDWEDGPTSCRDIVSSWDYDYYYFD